MLNKGQIGNITGKPISSFTLAIFLCLGASMGVFLLVFFKEKNPKLIGTKRRKQRDGHSFYLHDGMGWRANI